MSEQEIREKVARDIEGMAAHLAKFAKGGSALERSGLHLAARIARDLDHFRMVCDCGSEVYSIDPTTAEKYAAEHRDKGHASRIEDEREN